MTCHCLFTKINSDIEEKMGGKWHVVTFLSNYFPFFSYVHSKGLFSEQIIQAKTSPSLSLDNYVLGNQLKLSPNPSVEKFRHFRKQDGMHPFWFSLLHPFLILLLYVCVHSHTRLCLVTSKNSVLNPQIIIVLLHTSINIYSLLETAS